MEIHEHKQGAVTVIKPAGTLVGGDAGRLKSALSNAVVANFGRVILDASGVPFVDSRGIEALLDVCDELSQSGRAFKLCGTTATVREALDLTGVGESFEFFNDVQTAVRSFL